MWARLLYGGGLALVAAHLFAQGHVCGPGCSGSGMGYQAAPRLRDTAPMPPNLESAYSRSRQSNAFIDPRAMMRTLAAPFAPRQWSQQPRAFGSPMAEYPRRGHGRLHDQASRPQRNLDPFRRYETPQRGFDRPPASEDLRPIPQPSLTPQTGGVRGTSSLRMPERQPWSSRRLPMSPERRAEGWKI